MNNLCTAEGITFRYFERSSRNILENVSLSFETGKVHVILGRSGCGKSTLSAILTGLYPENGGYLVSGKVTVFGRDLAALSFRERSRYIAAMFQNPDLQFCMENLRQELYFCLENQCVPQEEMDERIDAFAARFHLTDLLSQPFYRMSGGEKQKAALACLLLIDPKILVLDEPFANLDSLSRQAYLSLLTQKVKEDHTTVIVIDHQAANWFSLADRYLILGEGGKVLGDYASLSALEDHRDAFRQNGLVDPFLSRKEKPSNGDGHTVSATDPVLTLRQVSVFHRKGTSPVLSVPDLTARKGEMIAILGPSGSGKTSLLLTLLGQKKYTGSIHLEKKELSRIRKKDLFAQLGMVFQNPGDQFVTTSVLEEVIKSLAIWTDLKGEALRERGRTLLAEFNLDAYARYSPYMLSQGQQRRLGVLAMLSGGQHLLLLDEPTYGQDGQTTRAIMDLLSQRAAQGLTVIFTTHDEALARDLADRIWQTKGGTVYEED